MAAALDACGGSVSALDGGSGVDGSAPSDGAVSTPEAGVDPLELPPQCTTGTRWTGGNAESERMNPGQACNACHETFRRAPRFAIAGTVYQSGHEPDNCNGGADEAPVIEITDATGAVVNIPVNAAGNFSSYTPMTAPYTARVLYQGRVRSMRGRIGRGDCNSCHTAEGTLGAPGRVTVP